MEISPKQKKSKQKNLKEHGNPDGIDIKLGGQEIKGRKVPVNQSHSSLILRQSGYLYSLN